MSLDRSSSSLARLVVVAAVSCAICSLSWPALADEVGSYEVVGVAPESDGGAREVALDRAFAVAVEKALVEMVAKKVRTAQDKKLRTEVILRARLFVSSYKVTDTFSSEGNVSLTVTVHVDFDKIRARLDELGIDPLVNVVEAPPLPSGDRPKIAVLLHSDVAGDIDVTFGDEVTRSGDRSIAARLFTDAVTATGFDVARSRGAKAPVTREADQGLPLTDAAARALAQDLDSGGAFVIGVQASQAGPIRGTRLVGATCVVHVRVIDVASGDIISNATFDGAAFGSKLDAVLAGAVTDAVGKATAATTIAIARQWPRPSVPDDAVVVRVRGFVVWSTIEAIVAQLEKTRGVDKVWPRAYSQSEVELAVVTELSSKSVAAAVAKTKLSDLEVQAKKRDARRVDATVDSR